MSDDNNSSFITHHSPLIPRLRFPEFREAGEWEEKRIENVCEKPFSGGTPITTNKSYYGGKIPFIRSAEIGSDSTDLFITEEGLKNSSAKIVKKGDVLVALYGANSGDVELNKIEGAINQAVLCLRSKESNEFLCQYLTYKKIDITTKYLQGGQGNLSGDIIKSIELLFPKSGEQQKIADCLSSIDALITAHSQKLDALKAHKKGLMQQLFPREGETVPRLRFPEFREAGEWDMEYLGALSKILRGGSPRPIDNYLTSDADGLNWLKIGDVDKESKFITDTTEKVKRTALAKTREVNPGDLIMSNSMSFGRPYILKIKSCIHDGWIAVTEIKKTIDSDYLYYLILSNSSQLYFLNAAAGGGIKNLNVDIIKLLPVAYPGKNEQQKIANCLASIDALITAQGKKIDALKAHKKGLMQQLFPVLDEERG